MDKYAISSIESIEIIKPKLFCDFDSTIVDSVSAFANIYTWKHMWDNGFEFPKVEKAYDWNLKDICPLLEDGEASEIFESAEFFQLLKPFENAIEALKVLKCKYEIVIVSIGGYDNIAHKSKWIKYNLPFVDSFIGIVNEGKDGCIMDKSMINMQGHHRVPNVFIDDNADNLLSQKDTKHLKSYCYGDIKGWNESYEGTRLFNWNEVVKCLLGWEMK